MRDYSKLDKLGRARYDSEDHRHIPYETATFRKNASGKWEEDPAHSHSGLTSRAIARESILKGLPGQSRNVKHKTNPFGNPYHEKYNRGTSYSPDGSWKSVFSVNWDLGYENERKLRNKSSYDRQRYLKKKAEK